LLIVPLFRQMLAFDLVDTHWGIILPQAFAPAMVLIVKRFFGRPADSKERIWAAICAEHGIGDPGRAATGGGFPVFPKADIKGIATTGFGGQ
jgi:hypothetical protein